MKVLITGVTSFVGYHLAAGFRAEGHEVIGAVSRPGMLEGIRGERTRRLAAAGVPLEPLDLTRPEEIADRARTVQPDLWIQHAGYTKNYAGADYDLTAGHALNVAPLGPIFAAMVELGGAVIVTGTVSEYADGDAPHTEDEACLPSTPYGLSKLTETLFARQLALRTGVPTRVARLFLPFGPLEAPEKLLPSVAAALRDGREVALSPCLQRRDVLPVEDVVALYLALADDLPRTTFDLFNVCSGEAPALRDVVLAIADTLGADPTLCRFGARPMRPGEPDIIVGSTHKARQLLGWSPTPWREAVETWVRSESTSATT
ncbi:NAD-dependent epimerase/dehydratase family protein [Amorphus orientalis]|uniref:Nucleoside-diphosphate-sugar epimerase n=1 Tax=Amorphus orientalis TaxID=649198 RepID=A0AAE3VKS9_9HYPH|nr:NAD(P)-dependent oxidoreductase [Amorphus orientalis]MDQ0313615.1 nucleoside-diphosphate-sugar epimerase [Amorphus orientalis]